MEGRHKISSGRLTKFSEQQLVDCSTANSGCAGGLPAKAFDYYKKNDALNENAYPYTGRQGRCRANDYKRGSGVRSSGHVNIHSNDPNAMKAAAS